LYLFYGFVSIAGVDMEEKAPESYMYKYPVQETYHVKKLFNGEREKYCLMVILFCLEFRAVI